MAEQVHYAIASDIRTKGAGKLVSAVRLIVAWHADHVAKPLREGAQVMADGAGGPTVLRILLGTQLRRLREARGVTAQEAARAIRGSESKISRIELGRNAVREVDIADLLSLYGVTDPDEREQLLSLASQANQPGWWHRYQDVLPTWFQAYIGLEESAEYIRSYDEQFIAGLPLWSIIDEVSLRRMVDSVSLMREQLQYLYDICERPGFTLQITSFPAG